MFVLKGKRPNREDHVALKAAEGGSRKEGP